MTRDFLGPLRSVSSFSLFIDPLPEICMRTGTVRWFNARKGYGFLKPVDGGFDVYVHVDAVKRAGLAELKEGQMINFESVADERTGEIFAENLSVPPDASSTTKPLLRPLAARKASLVWRSTT
jgi:cold shock protein